jgi:hypothetical protein
LYDAEGGVERLIPALAERCVNRAHYDPGPVDKARLDRVRTLAGIVDGARLEVFDRQTERGQALAMGTVEGTATINSDTEMSRDGHVWFRANGRSVAEFRDGVPIPAAGLSPVMGVLGQMMPKPDAAGAGEHWRARPRCV